MTIQDGLKWNIRLKKMNGMNSGLIISTTAGEEINTPRINTK